MANILLKSAAPSIYLLPRRCFVFTIVATKYYSFMLVSDMGLEIALLTSFVFTKFTVIPQVVVNTSNMRVQYGSLISFIVALVTFEKLFWIMSSHVHFQICDVRC